MEYIIRNCHKWENSDITRKLQSVLSECRSNGEENCIRFEKGEYHFYADFCDEEIIYASNTDSDRFPLKKSAINISGQKNLTVDGGGSLFIMHGKMIALKVAFSENITFKNFTWDFPCAGTLEMKLIKKSLLYSDYQLYEGCQWHIKGNQLHWYEKSVFDGKDYWHNVGQKESYCTVVSDEKSGNLSRYNVTDGPFMLCVGLKRLSENKVRIYSLRPLRKELSPGKVFELCTDKKRDCVGAFYLESKNITAENIAVRYMHGFGWLTQMCENVTFKGCDFTPDESSDRKSTSFADLIHVSGAKGRIHIESCRFSNAHDDPINIHGTYTVVKKKISDDTLLLEYMHNQQRGFKQYHQGDKAVFYLRENLQGFEKGREFTVKSTADPLEGECDSKQMMVTFTEKLPDEICIKDKYAVENVTYTPDVYIGGCMFSSIPTRGILCTTKGEVIIENNIFDGMTMASIYISDDCNSWYESGHIENMLIRNNTFIIKKAPVFKGAKPAILIEPVVPDISKAENTVHRNIRIESNTFYLEHSNAVDALLTENLTVKNNEIHNKGEEEILTAFRVKKCRNVIAEGNRFGERIDGNINNL